jgi:hypothetical protein
MMKRFFLPVVVLAILLVTSVQSAIAQDNIPQCDGPPCVYVDRNKNDGNEDGSQVHPYNAENEGRALAQSQVHGGWMFVKDTNGVWRKEFVSRATPGPYGTPIPDAVFYVILALIALILILVGWWLVRRSRQIKS